MVPFMVTAMMDLVTTIAEPLILSVAIAVAIAVAYHAGKVAGRRAAEIAARVKRATQDEQRKAIDEARIAVHQPVAEILAPGKILIGKKQKPKAD
jgi:hypothetical protein